MIRYPEPEREAAGRVGREGIVMSEPSLPAHDHRHAFADVNPREREGLIVASRRNTL